ncbi:MAG TPA: nitrite reductase large subunit NirB [Vicinamibacteria bacterium]|nr:nitrite reductase large subunit NirB [Vicinamibacteria bacterium]
MKQAERLVVVGNGMAALACLEKLIEWAPQAFAITVYGEEPYPNYDRVRLPAALAEGLAPEELILNPLGWYRAHDVDLRLGVRASAIDRDARVVEGSDRSRTPYDRLILATGSRPILLPLPGIDKDGVYSFRTLDDCERLRVGAERSARAVVVGGGLLGLEAAAGLRRLGLEVTVVHLLDGLMERQLDLPGSRYLERALAAQGIRILLGRTAAALLGNGRVEALALADGEVLPAELVVMAVGIRPDRELAQRAGLACRRGVVVDDRMGTSDPRVYALGECAEHRGICYGMVKPLYQQARVLAARLAEVAVPAYLGSRVSSRLKVSGIKVFSAGQHLEAAGDQVVRFEDAGRNVYKKLILREGRLLGAVLVGDDSEAADLDDLIENGQPVSLAGPLAGPSRAAQASAGCSESPDTVICGCNGVSRRAILEAVEAHRLTTRADVARITGASRACGGCGPQVDALLRLTVEQAGPAGRPLCACTHLTRQEVLAAIRGRRPQSVPGVMRDLRWSGDGCSACRPALAYFLTLCWPQHPGDLGASRHVNERVHANIQKDGTYSVVPRIYGGVTTPGALIRLAQVAERFEVPLLKITGGQRLALLGVRKRDLPAVWAALAMPSGFAYAKAVRTVKTCVGSAYCRFGTRDSLDLGIRLERAFEGLWMPAKVKMGVAGCPRNCAESLIKDVGLLGTERGWQIQVGGNGGTEVRQAELLASVEGNEEVVELVGAFLQLYREQADYGERTSRWCSRLGIEEIRRRVVEDVSNRRALLARLEPALSSRVDPWRERVQGLRTRESGVRREYERPPSVPGMVDGETVGSEAAF